MYGGPPSRWGRGMQGSSGLWLEIFRHPELGNASYLVGSGAEAGVIDPVRDVGRYLAGARERGARIRWVLETHLHNDFLSGGRELAELSGAVLGAPKGSRLAFPHRALANGERLDLGSGRLIGRASPGHTPEHTSYLLLDEHDRPRRLFSGGSLMVGSAARPDLLGPRHTLPLALDEWATLRRYGRELPAGVAVHPTHAGGSFCGAGASSAVASTVGRERRENRLIRADSFVQFIERYLTSDPFPRYYHGMRARNRHGPPALGETPEPPPRLSPEEVARAAGRPGVRVVDLRSYREFDAGHIPGSLYIGHEGAYTAWVGWTCRATDRFILVGTSEADQVEGSRALRRIGFDRILGQLAGGWPAYMKSGAPRRTTRRARMSALRRALALGKPMIVLDVRQPSEFAQAHLPGARSVPLGEVAARSLHDLPRDVPVYVHCARGERSAVAAGRLEALGFEQVVHITDGPEQWERGRAPRGPTGSGSRREAARPGGPGPRRWSPPRQPSKGR